MNITGLWDQLVDCICRPPRDEYAAADLPGGLSGSFKLKGKEYLRRDIQLVNANKEQIKASHLVPKYPPKSKDGKLPCVVYCHCNSGSRRDSEEALHLLLPQNITVFALDFVGSGQSDGKYVTLGWREQDDLALAIQHLRALGTVSTIGLWGRSMGAVTALLYSQRDPSIAGVVVDSPFAKLTELMLELVEEQKIPIPRSLMRVALTMMRRSVKKRAGFNIDEVAPIDQIHTSFIPCLFGHAVDDTFVAKAHSERLLAKYGGDKELCLFEGDHNSVRPRSFYTKVLMFFHVCLQCEDVLIPDEQNPGQFELAVGDAESITSSLEPPALPRTLSPIWHDIPAYAGDAEQMEKYLSSELTSQLARSGSQGSIKLPSQEAAGGSADDSTSVPGTAHMRQEGQPEQTLTDEAALARALHLSLVEVQHQERGHVAGSGAQPAAAASTALQDTIPEHMQGMAPEDAEEAMLAAAIRASLIEAGEPDTSAAAPASEQPLRRPTSNTSNKQHQQQQQQQHQQQQAVALQPSSSTLTPPSQTPSAKQQSRHREESQQAKQQHRLRFQEEPLLNGRTPSPDHDATLLQPSSMAAVQDTGLSETAGQRTSQWGSRQASSAASGGQLHTAWSAGDVFARSNSAGMLERDSSDSCAGFLHSRQKAASQGNLASQDSETGQSQEQDCLTDDALPQPHQERRNLLPQSMSAMLSSPRRHWRYIACCMHPDVVDGSMRPAPAKPSSSSRPPSATHKSQRVAHG
ncbi:hypothetical protein ABBQ38_011671 [Trebouxia sp. C0009 RCD-2024]